MKTRITLLLLICVSLWSCEKPKSQDNPHEFIYLDRSEINGQLCCTANPFNPEKDTVLCLKNVYIGFTGYDADYCSYVRDLLSQVGGKFEECQFEDRGVHTWEYLAKSEQYFYPISSTQFVSIIDPNTGMIADSVSLNGRIIYPRQNRKEDSNRYSRFYSGDFVNFIGSDYMKPKFITDTITLSSELIIRFDAHQGPFEGDPRLTNDNPNIFNQEPL